MWHASSKRLFDIVCASVGLLVLSPAGLVIGLLVKLSDGGPIFYGQTRIGQFGKPFRIRKFRSMVLNADKMGVPVTKEEDPRITWIGRFLRKSKLDELPQLWNVLVGQMSFVGPRPEGAPIRRALRSGPAGNLELQARHYGPGHAAVPE